MTHDQWQLLYACFTNAAFKSPQLKDALAIKEFLISRLEETKPLSDSQP